MATGHTSHGLNHHYGHWVKSQVSDEEFESFSNHRMLTEPRFGGNACDWDTPLRYHNSVWTADRTIDFLEEQDGAQPFLLAVGFQDPHHPHCVPTEFQNRVKAEDVPTPDWTEGELDDKPAHYRMAREGCLNKSDIRGQFVVAGQGIDFDYREVCKEAARLGRAYYYAMVRFIDREMGRILESLDRTGLAENTLVFFTTDHGELLGDHGLWCKGPFHYEQIVRAPMIVRWPAGFAGAVASTDFSVRRTSFPRHWLPRASTRGTKWTEWTRCLCSGASRLPFETARLSNAWTTPAASASRRSSPRTANSPGTAASRTASFMTSEMTQEKK